jgi:hypothetical protein
MSKRSAWILGLVVVVIGTGFALSTVLISRSHAATAAPYIACNSDADCALGTNNPTSNDIDTTVCYYPGTTASFCGTPASADETAPACAFPANGVNEAGNAAIEVACQALFGSTYEKCAANNKGLDCAYTLNGASAQSLAFNCGMPGAGMGGPGYCLPGDSPAGCIATMTEAQLAAAVGASCSLLSTSTVAAVTQQQETGGSTQSLSPQTSFSTSLDAALTSINQELSEINAPGIAGNIGTTNQYSSTSFPVTVLITAPVLNVRSAPNTTASLAGSQTLVQGDTFTATNEVVGQSVSEDFVTSDLWWVSSLGNYVWSGGTTVAGSGNSVGSNGQSSLSPQVTGSNPSISSVQGYNPTTNVYESNAGVVNAGDTYIILYGTFDVSGNTVSINGQALSASDIAYQNSTQINAIIGSGYAGAPFTVSVSNAQGISEVNVNASSKASLGSTKGQTITTQLSDSNGNTYGVTYSYLPDGEVSALFTFTYPNKNSYSQSSQTDFPLAAQGTHQYIYQGDEDGLVTSNGVQVFIASNDCDNLNGTAGCIEYDPDFSSLITNIIASSPSTEFPAGLKFQTPPNTARGTYLLDALYPVTVTTDSSGNVLSVQSVNQSGYGSGIYWYNLGGGYYLTTDDGSHYLMEGPGVPSQDAVVMENIKVASSGGVPTSISGQLAWETDAQLSGAGYGDLSALGSAISLPLNASTTTAVTAAIADTLNPGSSSPSPSCQATAVSSTITYATGGTEGGNAQTYACAYNADACETPGTNGVSTVDLVSINGSDVVPGIHDNYQITTYCDTDAAFCNNVSSAMSTALSTYNAIAGAAQGTTVATYGGLSPASEQIVIIPVSGIDTVDANDNDIYVANPTQQQIASSSILGLTDLPIDLGGTPAFDGGNLSSFPYGSPGPNACIIFIFEPTVSLFKDPLGLTQAVEHEMGHCFGLSHNNATINLMNSGTDGTNLNITPQMQQALVDMHNGTPINLANDCTAPTISCACGAVGQINYFPYGRSGSDGGATCTIPAQSGGGTETVFVPNKNLSAYEQEFNLNSLTCPSTPVIPNPASTVNTCFDLPDGSVTCYCGAGLTQNGSTCVVTPACDQDDQNNADTPGCPTFCANNPTNPSCNPCTQNPELAQCHSCPPNQSWSTVSQQCLQNGASTINICYQNVDGTESCSCDTVDGYAQSGNSCVLTTTPAPATTNYSCESDGSCVPASDGVYPDFASCSFACTEIN